MTLANNQEKDRQGIEEKIRLVSLLETSRQESLNKLKGIDDRAIVYAESGWRVQDLLGHLAAWEREVLAVLQAYNEGESYTIGEDYVNEIYNIENYEKRKGYDPIQCRVDWGMVRRDLQFAVNELDPRLMQGTLRFPWGPSGSVTELIEDIVEHEVQHVEDILAVVSPDPGANPR